MGLWRLEAVGYKVEGIRFPPRLRDEVYVRGHHARRLRGWFEPHGTHVHRGPGSMELYLSITSLGKRASAKGALALYGDALSGVTAYTAAQAGESGFRLCPLPSSPTRVPAMVARRRGR